ncbi:MAG: bile acid:sodium symporter [Gammaproteobacteria bacterium]|nr:bile acid:sodium symporter [Gammaproteobacteria bacterium]
MAVLIKYTVMISVILLMLGVGMGTSFRQVVDAVKQFGVILRGVLANFLVTPLLIYLVLLNISLPPDVKIGIMLMAAAPVAPMAPPFVEGAKGDVAYGVGLMVVVAILSVILTPLILGLALPKSEEGITLDPMQIVQILVTVQLIPISIGMAIRQYTPNWAELLLNFVPKIGKIGLIVGVGLLLVSQSEHIMSISLVTYLVLALLVMGCLFIGDMMLISEPEDKRRALAVSTAIRNIPLAFLIAGSSFPDSVVGPVTLVFSVLTMVLSTLYGKLRKCEQ